MALKTVYQNKGETLARIKPKGESTHFVPRNEFFTTDKDIEFQSKGIVVFFQEQPKPKPKKKKATKKVETRIDETDEVDSKLEDNFEAKTDNE